MEEYKRNVRRTVIAGLILSIIVVVISEGTYRNVFSFILDVLELWIIAILLIVVASLILGKVLEFFSKGKKK